MATALRFKFVRDTLIVHLHFQHKAGSPDFESAYYDEQGAAEARRSFPSQPLPNPFYRAQGMLQILILLLDPGLLC
jgi:hypothetical protein